MQFCIITTQVTYKYALLLQQINCNDSYFIKIKTRNQIKFI